MKAAHWLIVVGLAAIVAGGILWMLRGETPPRRKSGLWELTNQSTSGSAPTTTQICIDQATDDLLHGVGASRMECSETEWKREGDRVEARTVCEIERSKATANVVLSGDFDTAYHNEVFVVFDPPMRGNDQLSMSQDARWIGPCPEDLKPGDIVMPDGSIRTADEENAANVAEEPAAAEPPPPEGAPPQEIPADEAAPPEP